MTTKEIRVRYAYEEVLRVEGLTRGAFTRVVVDLPVIERVDPRGLLFAHDSALVSPVDASTGPTGALATALGRLANTEGSRLVVLGHASVPGSDGHNASLSNARAGSVAALIRGDRDAWVDIATQDGSPADIQRWLDHFAASHGYPTAPGRTDGVLDEQSVAAVQSFQAHYNAAFGESIEQHGKITRETLGAIFDVVHHELEVRLEAIGVADPRAIAQRLADDHVIGCGAELVDISALVESTHDDGRRRVDLVILPPDNPWTPDRGARPLLASSRHTVLEYDARTAHPQDLVVRLVDHYDRPLSSRAYTLHTAEGDRSGVTDGDGLLVEPAVSGALRLTLVEGGVVLFDDHYREAAAQRSAPDKAPADEDIDDDHAPQEPDEGLGGVDVDDHDDDLAPIALDDDDDDDDDD